MRALPSGPRGGLLRTLLFASVLTPAAASALHWPIYPSRTALAAAVVGVSLGAMSFRLTRRSAGSFALSTIVAILLAFALAAVLRERANAFYTPNALFGGSLVLVALLVGGDALRRVLRRDEADAARMSHLPDSTRIEGLERLPPNEVRAVRASRTAAVHLATTGEDADAIALADRLVQGAGYLLVGFWGLVAFGRLHIASALLLLTGLLLLVRCVALLPPVLGGRAANAPAAPRRDLHPS